ncbi:histone deacetylase 14, chloroplastic-like [Rutidosis leptorrhynchoides]|uniref:histone deacetylase 14, chloroplastic-like n=1 Tax=Rutidosis leptorrhynchoides TaxID=125765 RepID=UPI003A995CEB
MKNLHRHHYHKIRSGSRLFLSARTNYSAASSKLVVGGKTYEDIPKVVYNIAPPMDHKKELYVEHNTRLPSILSALEKAKLTPEFRGSEIVQLNSSRKATLKDIQSVHYSNYLSILKKFVEDAKSGKPKPKSSDLTFAMQGFQYVTATSYEVSLAAAGSGLSLVDFAVAASKINENCPVGFALMPPPMHHVLRTESGGCCYFENAGIAARYAQRVHGLNRVLIIDFDVHYLSHTNDAFYDDPDIFVLSTHWDEGYHGKFDDTGSGRGEGATLNLPLPEGSGDIAMQSVFDEVIVPCAQKFKPDIIIVSAGYDGHVVDPTGSFQLTTGTYFTLASGIKQLAKDLCGGRCVFFLEGGESEGVVSFSVAESFRAFVGEQSMAPEFEKKYAFFLHDEPINKVKQAIQRTKHLHSI